MLLQITVGKSYSLIDTVLKVTGALGPQLCRFVVLKLREFAFPSREKTFNIAMQFSSLLHPS